MAPVQPNAFILKTKLTPPPRWGVELIERPRLLAQMEHSRDKRLVLITASAGYGKSTLISQWCQILQERGECIAWLTLDENDNDPVRLFTYLSYALVGETQPLKTEQNISRNELEQLVIRFTAEGPATLFIDDLEAVSNPDSLQLLDQLQQLLPAGGQLVIASRNKPAWGLAKLKMQGGLLEMDERMLRLESDEVRQVSSLATSRRIDSAQVGRLVEKTEGWIAGVRLALLCLAETDDTHQWVESLNGETAEITEFLAVEMFRHLEVEQQLFLLKVAVAQRISAPLCEHLTGLPDAQTQLHSFCRRGLFVQPIDNEHHWFRIHGLVRQFLLRRLKQQMPQRLPELHRRAAQWFAAHDSKVEAVHHAIAAEDFELASQILAVVSHRLLKRGQLHTLCDLAGRIPTSALAVSPVLMVDLSWALLLRHRRREAVDVIRRLQKMDKRGELGNATDEVPGLPPLLLMIEDRVQESAQLAERNLKHLEPDAYFARGVLTNILAYERHLQGDFEQSRCFQLQSRASHLESGSQFGLAYSDMMGAMRERSVGGSLIASRDRYAQIGLGPDYGQPAGSSTPVAVARGVVNGFEVDLLYALNELDEAEARLKEYFHLSVDYSTAPDMAILAFLTQARLAFVKGNLDRVEHYLDEGEIVGLRWPLPRLIQVMRWQRIQFALLRGNIDEASALADQALVEGVPPTPPGYLYLVDEWAGIDLIPLRLRAFRGDGEAVLDELEGLLQAGTENRAERHLRLLALKAQVLLLIGDEDQADIVLSEAVDISARIGAVRTLIDEGESVVQRLQQLYNRWRRHPDRTHRERCEYCRTLLAAAGRMQQENESLTELVEPLSDREIQLLSLVGQGLKNEQIAEQIFLSINTVKWHLRRAYEKLGVGSRTEALAEARKHHLID